MGKKFKESKATAKLKIYRRLEGDLEKQSQISEGITLCVPGCTDCCSDYFTTQRVEFDLILNELAKWDKEKLDNLIEKVDKYWKILESQYPEVKRLLLNTTNDEIEEINSSINKTSFPCIFLDETTQLCQIYDIRPFKCRIFGNTYYSSKSEEGAIGIVCHRYDRLLNEDNFDLILCDVTALLDKNTDLSITLDKKRKVAVINPEYPLIYYLYQHFIVRRLGGSSSNLCRNEECQ